MYDLTRLFTPATAQPRLNTAYYSEIPPCEALRPYIRCFWGTACPVVGADVMAAPTLVIPDGCMDIIFRADYDSGRVTAVFCGLDESGSCGGSAVNYPGITLTFGVRFYLWSAHIFAETSLCGTSGEAPPAGSIFSGFVRDMKKVLVQGLSLRENARCAEKLLAGQLCRFPDENLMNALHFIVGHSGRATVGELQIHTACTRKRLERLFRENTGAAPKAVSSVIRYQLLWQDMLRRGVFNVHDMVEKFGYYDQPHLLNDFRRRHTMTPQAALEHALNS